MKFPKTKEDVLIEALHLKENGLSQEEIISRFPESQKDIQEILETEIAVSAYFNSITPSPNALFSILKTFPTDAKKQTHEKNIADSAPYRYTGIFSRVGSRFNIKEELSDLILKKFLVPSVAVILLITGITTLRNQSKIQKDIASTEDAAPKENKISFGQDAKTSSVKENGVSLPGEPTTDPTAITDAIITLTTNEQSEIFGYDDEDLLSSNSQEIAELNTIYDETDFQ